MTVPLVRVSAYIPFLDFLDEAEIRPAQAFGKSFIAAVSERNAETFVPAHLAHSILEKGARKLGLADFGYVVGQNARIGDLGAFGRSLCHSMTLYDALGKARTKFALYSSAEQITWTCMGLDVLFFHRYRQRTGRGSHFAQQCALLLMRDFIRLGAGAKWQPGMVFSPAPSEDAQIMTDVFDGAVVRQAKHYGFAFPFDFLHLPIAQQSSAGDANSKHGYSVFETSAPAHDFVGAVKQVIAALIIDGRCQLGEISQAIGLKPRTLQRRLAEYGVHFSDVLSRVRFEQAKKLMSDPDVRIIDIAFELGYSDPAHFSRAFHSWTGIAPSEFQRKQLGLLAQ